MLTNIGENTISDQNKTFWKSKFNWLILLMLIVTLGMWITVRIQGTVDANLNYYFSLMLGVIPFVASFKGFIAAKRWGGVHSVLGRSVGALSAGVFLWGAGELVWSYYNLVLKEAAPYPSVADILFVPGFGMWILSGIFLLKLAGVNLVLRKKPLLWWLVGALLVAGTALSYYLLVVVAREGVVLTDTASPVKVFLDIYYPLADFISLTLVTIIVAVSGKYIGGKLKTPIFLVMLGLAGMYVGDVLFGYTTTKETFYNANFGDLILLIGISILSFSLLAYAETVPRLNTNGEEK